MVRFARYQVLKVRRHVGPAKVFDSEEDAIQAVWPDVAIVVVRFVGPKVVLVCAEILSLSSMIVGKVKEIRLPSTDGRFSEVVNMDLVCRTYRSWKLRMVDQLPTFVQAISLRLAKIPRNFHGRIGRRTWNGRQKQHLPPLLLSGDLVSLYRIICFTRSRDRLLEIMDKSGKKINSKKHAPSASAALSSNDFAYINKNQEQAESWGAGGAVRQADADVVWWFWLSLAVKGPNTAIATIRVSLRRATLQHDIFCSRPATISIGESAQSQAVSVKVMSNARTHF